MKRKFLLITSLILTVGVLSTSLAACGGVSFTTARLSEAAMAASVDETTHQPIDKTDTFSSDAPIIFASVKLSNAPKVRRLPPSGYTYPVRWLTSRITP